VRLTSRIHPFLLVFLALFLFCCAHPSEGDNSPGAILPVKPPEETLDFSLKPEASYPQHICGWSEEFSELYVCDYTQKAKNLIKVKVINTTDGGLKREILLKRGEPSAPDEFTEIIARVKKIGEKYYIFNGFKIACLGEGGEVEWANFIEGEFRIGGLDFRGDEVFAMVYDDKEDAERDYEVRFERMKKVGRLKLKEKLKVFKANYKGVLYYGGKDRRGRAIFLVWLGPKPFVYEGGGEIFFSMSNIAGFYALKNDGRLYYYELPFLKPLVFSKDEIKKMGEIGWSELLLKLKRTVLEFKVIPNESLYYLYMLPAGKGKLLFLTDLDLEKMEGEGILVDINGQRSWRIRLPIGTHFLFSLWEHKGSFSQIYLNMEEKFFAYGTFDEEKDENLVNVYSIRSIGKEK